MHHSSALADTPPSTPLSEQQRTATRPYDNVTGPDSDIYIRRILTFWLAGVVALLVVTYVMCDGHFVYTLDDPYIHLSVARQILAGGFGVNAGEFSSPSSSIIWPYLMAVTEALGLGAAGPLLVSLIAAGLTVWTALRMLVAEGVIEPVKAPWVAYTIGLLVIFLTSSLALPMTGLEHSLHILVAVKTLDGLLAAARGRAPGWTTVGAITLMPLVRFEGLAFAGAAIVALWFLDARREAVIASAMIAVGLALYSVLALSRGLPLLPSSVLIKSAVASQSLDHQFPLSGAAQNIVKAAQQWKGIKLMILGLLLVAGVFIDRPHQRRVLVWVAVLLAVAAHLAGGNYSWFHRYEVYIVAVAGLSVLMLFFNADFGNKTIFVRAAALLYVGLVSVDYVYSAAASPLASRNIYDQQEQMARFAHDFYGRPVAVNDLGLVSYRSPAYVLDLWGLGSEPVRKLRFANTYSAAEVESLAQKYNVGLAMVYQHWLGDKIPSDWRKLAVLHTPRFVTSGADVSFYVTPLGNGPEIEQELKAFAASLPARDHLDIAMPAASH